MASRYMWLVKNKHFFAYYELNNLADAEQARETDARLTQSKLEKVYVTRTDIIENGEVIERTEAK